MIDDGIWAVCNEVDIYKIHKKENIHESEDLSLTAEISCIGHDLTEDKIHIDW